MITSSCSKYLTFVFAIIFAISLKECYCHKNMTNRSNWPTAKVTWYGPPDGPGCTGGACGYTTAVEHPPFDKMVTAAGPSLYRDGKGCGTCYKIMCTGHPSCSRKLIKVVIADECPGCTSEKFHFDLSGRAYGCLAKPGHADKLRNAGIIHVKFKRAHCHYKNHNLAFHMDAGANPYYVSFLVKFANGDGNFACIEIKPAGCDSYIKMEEMKSAVWKLNSGTPLNGPYDVRLTSGVSGKKIVAKAAIPAGWTPGAVYRSNVNF